MLECVVNVSEGRDQEALRALAAECGAALLDLHCDADHHRSVFTLAGPEDADAVRAARALAEAVEARVAMAGHDGVHPLLGALDVVPFVGLHETDAERAGAVRAAREFGAWWAETHDVPVFLYDDADPSGRDLPRTRREAFTTRAPDFGPSTPHASLGATAVGARRPLVAINVWLATDDVGVARRIAASVRERDGGLPGVRALGLALASCRQVQVSMNLVDLARTGVEAAVAEVRERARREPAEVTSVELVGLVPRRELDRCSAAFREWAGLGGDIAVEDRIGLGPRALPGAPDAAGAG
jgi:glutamate formiminotransferase